MEITLEKIELVKDRTGVTYREAKEALEQSEGNVVDAIIAIEETIDRKPGRKLGDRKEALIAGMKERQYLQNSGYQRRRYPCKYSADRGCSGNRGCAVGYDCRYCGSLWF